MGSAERASFVAGQLMRRGLVPRTFPAGHPAGHCLRFTVRAPQENDQLIGALARIATEVPT